MSVPAGDGGVEYDDDGFPSIVVFNEPPYGVDR